MTSEYSVVIPLYNKEQYIKRAIDSVMGQTIQDFEIIVVDDGSTDKGAKIVLNFENPRIRLVQQANSGVSSARNRGIKEGKSRFIAFLDADDEWTPNFLEEVSKLIEKYPFAGLYGTGVKDEFGNISGNIKSISELKDLVPSDGLIRNYFQIVKKGYYILSSSSVVVPKKVFLELGGFREDLWWGEDEDMWSRIALKYPIAYSTDLIVIYYENVVNGAFRKQKSVEFIPFIDSARESINCGDVPVEILKDLEEYIEYCEVATAIHNIRCGDNDLGLKFLTRKNIRLFNRNKIMRSLLSSAIRNNFPYVFKSIQSRKRNKHIED